MNEVPIVLESGYYLKEMSEKDFFPLFGRHYDRLFGGDHTFFPDAFYSAEEKAKLKALGERFGNVYRLHVGVFTPKHEFVGFSFGYQETGETFYMVCSGILDEHRRKGLYSALLEHVIETTRNVGFQVVYSTHCATNNAVIIPKLKAGFVIAKLELSDMFGVVVNLHYYTNPLRRKVMDYRSGWKIPDAEIMSKMKYPK
ncbi:MAG: GNAT family N-acetyltransferase [Chitinophagaceae bacterium]|nr:GNAT family N-acetyltransferase [Oligoflexus sp.]